jgi:hypothetical protein
MIKRIAIAALLSGTPLAAAPLTMPDGKKIPTGFFSKPSSILISEAFKIRNGLIQQVEAVGASVPYHMHPGWG